MFGVVLLLFVTGACLASEPTCSCSPFEYEEKLLAKMIRQEFMFEKFKEDMFALQNKVIDKLADIDNERDKYKSEMQNHAEEFQTLKETLHNEVNEERDVSKADVKEELKILKHEFTNIMSNNTKQMKNHAQEFQKLKDALDGDTVAFFSKDVSDITPSNGQTFIFTTPIINEGNGYNKVTGKFTAPVGGLYKFDLQLCLTGGSSHYIYFYIMADNNQVQAGYFRDDDTYKCYTADTLVRLQTGGIVWVKCYSCSGSVYQSSNTWNTFSGIRIHA